MKIKKETWILIIACIFVSIASHAFFVKEWLNGSYMIGPDDGLSQMVPFREMLYDHYSRGDFFYSYEYGLGGGTFSQLAYYYATNLVFWIASSIVFILESFHLINKPDVLFWAQTTLFISISRQAAVIFLAAYTFRYMKFSLIPSFTGAVLYGASIMYFRHATYWEFFSDAFLWLPVLVIGIEKVIREGKPGWLVAAVAISAFDNFYFAFIHCIFALLYIGFRWTISLEDKELKRFEQFKLFIIGAGLGAGIGSFSFIPAVYGFLNNFRPSYEDNIPLLDLEDNILLDEYRFLLPAVFVMLIFVFNLYKNNAFRLFVIFSLVITAMHYMPVMWSVFNGFSAPQGRFQYLGSFTVGAAVASGLSVWKKIKWRQILVSSLCALVAYSYFFYRDETYNLADLKQSMTSIGALLVLLAWILLARKKTIHIIWLICLITVVVNTGILYQYQAEKLYKAGRVEDSTKDYILSENYYSKEQVSLINQTLSQDDQPIARMEWKTDGRNNTPIIQGFTGTSVYSSVLNKNLLFFYYHDLEIDMKRESVSRYAGFGDRANLHSLFAGTYVMQKKEQDTPVPYGFAVHKQTDDYVLYKNSNILPFVRASGAVYEEEDVRQQEILAREQAMLDGIVIEDAKGETEVPPKVKNIINQAEIEEAGSEYNDGLLHVKDEVGGIDIKISDPPGTGGDYYVSFYLNQAKGMKKGFPLHVNNFKTTRKPADSIYRTKVNKITIRVQQADTVAIRMPEGNYRLENLKLFYEDYQKLEQAAASPDNQAKVELKGNRILIDYNNTMENRYLTIPVPYEKGWQVTVNGQRQKVEKANFAFLGTQIQPGENTIEFIYYPPYFKLTLIISLLSFITAIIWTSRHRRKINVNRRAEKG